MALVAQPGRAVPLVFLADHPVRMVAHLARLVPRVVGAANHTEVVDHGSILADLEGLVACHTARGTVDPMEAADTRREHLVAVVDGHSNDPNRKDLAHADRSRALEAA